MRVNAAGRWKGEGVPRAADVIDGIARDLLGAPLPLSIRCWDRLAP